MVQYSTRKEAEKAAAGIRELWESKGYSVQTWIVIELYGRMGRKLAHPIYCVRSNMKNGIPTKERVMTARDLGL